MSDKKKSYIELLPEDGNFTEDDLWEAIAEANDMDVSEIADGDLVEWL
jgi:transketolase N-terminal domain/subunit